MRILEFTPETPKIPNFHPKIVVFPIFMPIDRPYGIGAMFLRPLIPGFLCVPVTLSRSRGQDNSFSNKI